MEKDNVYTSYKEYINENNHINRPKENIINKEESIKTETIDILDGMFDKVKNPTFDTVDGKLVSVTFEVTEADFNVEYEEALVSDINDNVRNKRIFDISLTFDDSWKFEGSYFMKFNIDAELSIDKKIHKKGDDEFYTPKSFRGENDLKKMSTKNMVKKLQPELTGTEGDDIDDELFKESTVFDYKSYVNILNEKKKEEKECGTVYKDDKKDKKEEKNCKPTKEEEANEAATIYSFKDFSNKLNEKKNVENIEECKDKCKCEKDKCTCKDDKKKDEKSEKECKDDKKDEKCKDDKKNEKTDESVRVMKFEEFTANLDAEKKVDETKETTPNVKPVDDVAFVHTFESFSNMLDEKKKD